MGIKLNFERSTLNHLENHEIKLVNVNLIKGIIEELGIEDVVIGFLEATSPEISTEVLEHLCKKFNIDRI